MQPFTWSPRGAPAFGEAVEPGRRLSLPRGDCPQS
jgi:hypothetical protein